MAGHGLRWKEGQGIDIRFPKIESKQRKEEHIKKARLLIIPWLIFLAGCTTAINLNKHASEGIAAKLKQQPYQRKFQITCSYGLRNYVYNGRPSGLTGSEPHQA